VSSDEMKGFCMSHRAIWFSHQGPPPAPHRRSKAVVIGLMMAGRGDMVISHTSPALRLVLTLPILGGPGLRHGSYDPLY
jgi:hypothetical protein